MKEMLGHILEMALAAIIVTFLIIMLYAGNMNGHSGVFSALFNNGYNSVSDKVNQNTNVKVKTVISTLPDDFDINYIKGIQKVAAVEENKNSAVWKNLYNFEEFITVRYEHNDYCYDKSTGKWQIKTSDGYKDQTENNQKNFRVYISGITDINGKNVLLSDKVENLSDDIPNKVLYDEDDDLVACFMPGTYNFTVKITETGTRNVIEKTISIPFTE